MSDSKKIVSLLFIILLCVTSYHDLTHNPRSEAIVSNHSHDNFDDDLNAHFRVISIRVTNGDQFLTIMEQINPNKVKNIEQAVADFQSLNLSADIYHLENERVYLFPVYHDFH